MIKYYINYSTSYTNSKLDNFCATTSYYSKGKMNFSKSNSNDDIYNKELQS